VATATGWPVSGQQRVDSQGRAAPAPAKPTAKPRTLSNWEQRELAELPERIEQLEARVAELTGQLADPALYQDDGGQVARINAELESAQSELDAAFARWEELDAKASA